MPPVKRDGFTAVGLSVPACFTFQGLVRGLPEYDWSAQPISVRERISEMIYNIRGVQKLTLIILIVEDPNRRVPDRPIRIYLDGSIQAIIGLPIC